MNVAQQCRIEKEQHPERYCPDKRCLWKIETRNGFNPCRNHPWLMPKTPPSATEGNDARSD